MSSPLSISNERLFNAISTHTRTALDAADTNHSGALTATERRRLPEDVFGLADATATSTANASLHGNLPIKAYADAFDRYLKAGIDGADQNRSGRISPNERDLLPPPILASLHALETSDPTGLYTPPATPTPPDAPPVAPPPTVAPPPSAGPDSTASLGMLGTLRPADITLTKILSNTSGHTYFNNPTGIAFHPTTHALWVVNRGDDSSVIINNPGQPGQSASKYRDDSDHFMNNPMQLAFSPKYDEVATIQESVNDYNGHAAMGNMFTGPTLFEADRAHYNGASQSHIDMLHHSPNGVGIAAGEKEPRSNGLDREYYVFNGDAGSIDRYFFNKPHVAGGDDHADGVTIRYAPGTLKRVPGVPGHLAYDPTDHLLYAADTGHGRIICLDPDHSTSQAHQITGYEDETALYQVDNAVVTVLTTGLSKPCGLMLYNDRLFVSEYGTGHIKVFTKQGERVADVDTGLGAKALTGLAAGPDGHLYFLNTKTNEVIRLDINAH